jgi:hypothetical protein
MRAGACWYDPSASADSQCGAVYLDGHFTVSSMRRLAMVGLCLSAVSRALPAQKPAGEPDIPALVVRAQIDAFVKEVRDMAAWAIVTPAAHIPVGGMQQDSAGPVESVVITQNAPSGSSDSALAAFRVTLGNAARRRKVGTVGLAYLVRRAVPGARDSVDAVLVEYERVTGERADVLFPYTRNEFGEPVFGRSYALAGTLRVLSEKRPRRSSR